MESNLYSIFAIAMLYTTPCQWSYHNFALSHQRHNSPAITGKNCTRHLQLERLEAHFFPSYSLTCWHDSFHARLCYTTMDVLQVLNVAIGKHRNGHIISATKYRTHTINSLASGRCSRNFKSMVASALTKWPSGECYRTSLMQNQLQKETAYNCGLKCEVVGLMEVK